MKQAWGGASGLQGICKCKLAGQQGVLLARNSFWDACVRGGPARRGGTPTQGVVPTLGQGLAPFLRLRQRCAMCSCLQKWLVSQAVKASAGAPVSEGACVRGLVGRLSMSVRASVGRCDCACFSARVAVLAQRA